MSEQAKDTTEETIKYETMPGADAIEAVSYTHLRAHET